MSVSAAAEGLGPRGSELWSEVIEDHELDVGQRVVLLEACRTVDRLEGLDDVVRGKGVLNLMRFRVGHAVDDQGVVTVEMSVDNVLSEARQQATVLKQLIAALRLPDEQTGKRPQQRGGARGAYKPSGAAAGAARVTAIDRARARAGA